MYQHFIPFYGMFTVYTYHHLFIHSSLDGHLSHFHLWKWKKVKVAQSCLTLCNLMDCPWNSPGQNTGVGSLFLLRGIFPTQGLNPGLPHCRWTLYQLSHKGSPETLKWVAYPFSRGSSQPRNQPGVSRIAGGFFTNWATRETLFFFGYCE